MELLAPAGNLQKLKVAVLYGADAVYLAGSGFGLRETTDNFSDSELWEAVSFAHAHDVKIYLTLNAFLHEQEMAELPEYVKRVEEAGVDAVIVSDLGVMSVVQRITKMPIHLSTQASCLNLQSARAWKELGVKRVILGREVSIEEASQIRVEAGLEVELFVHGAMCMAYSGNCTISNYTAGRDSNRGGCVQSCRFSYRIEAYPEDTTEMNGGATYNTSSFMSSKDLRGIHLLPKMMESGIDAIKIEGRMKSSLYVAATVQSYSRAIMEASNGNEKRWRGMVDELSASLEKIPHRDYTDGSLEHPAGVESIFYGNRTRRVDNGYEMAGTILEVNNDDYLALHVLNPFENKHVLEILTFEGGYVEIPAGEFSDVLRNPLKKALPNRVVLLPFRDGVQPLNVARIRSC